MASCLGICAESNLIKYAKVSKDHDNFNVDAFGVKLFDKLEDAISQIVEETQSNNIPININLTDEMYNKFEVFNGLKKKDIKSILSSEFELLCEDKNYNFQTLTSQYILSNTPLNKEKTTALYVSANKGDIAGKLQRLEKHRINNLIPVPVALYNIANTKKENTAIINIEDKTTITTIVNDQITDIQVLDIGMKQILDKISRKENSYARAYEACKNTTIYTMDIAESQLVGNEYLEDIMPVLYEIVTQVKDVLENNFISVQRMLLTGTATAINNVELYFQEYFTSAKCEILTPNFVEKKPGNINIKDYIEVNSAIALARQGLGEGIQDTNFKNIYTKGNIFEEIKRLATKDIEIKKPKSVGKKSFNLSFDLKGAFDRVERDMIRVATTFVLLMILFAIVSVILSGSINSKIKETEDVIADTKSLIAQIEGNTTKTQAKINEYSSRIQRLEELNNQIKTAYKFKRAIPNLLNQIKSTIPVEVQITSIENTTDSKIIIKAQAERYEELGYFGAVLKNQGILLDVTTTTGTREGNLVKIDIEGNLP